MSKKIALLGSTGSIGTQTLDVIDHFAGEFTVEIISAHTNKELVLKQTLKYHPKFVVLTDKSTYEFIKIQLADKPYKILYGIEGILQALQALEIDLVVGAISGAAGIKPVIEALKLGIDVALANKETIVAAGPIVKEIIKTSGASLIPVDSEHSAIMQCLEQEKQAVQNLLLTASGGPFWKFTQQELNSITPEQALKHPNWSMGKKITIDSATLMNKGLEVIEAHFLFDVDYNDIKVVIHPQSIIHSMVEYGDGSILAHLGLPDMRIPIQYALTYPQRKNNDFPKLDLTKVVNLEFYPPDFGKFPNLKLAYEAGKTGQTMPAVLNAANEVAVELFLQGELSFTEIPKLVVAVLEKHEPRANFELEDIFEVDAWARTQSKKYSK